MINLESSMPLSEDLKGKQMRNSTVRTHCDCGERLINEKEYEFMGRGANSHLLNSTAIKRVCSTCNRIYWHQNYKGKRKGE